MTGPRIGSLFTGYGGLDMGVQSVIGGTVEWVADIEPAACMGLPEGHVTGHGLSATDALKLCGNGVVPQQAAHALRLLGVGA